MDITISVIVPAYNASSTIGKTLEALLKQNCFQPFEVIVVDDGSKDNTAQIVQAFPSVKYVFQTNAGPAAARNHGAKVAAGQYLAFTDSDCVPHIDWLSSLMNGFSKLHVAVVAGSYGIVNHESWLARCIHAEIIWRHHHLMPDFPNAFGSYNFCVNKQVFEVVGGFNTRYLNASGEDNDLSYKVRKTGARIYFERRALVSHYHTTQVLKYLKEQFRHGFWRVKMYKDHPRMMKGDGYTYWKDIAEMPISVLLLAGLLLSFARYITLINGELFLIALFLVFEIFSAIRMTRCFFDGILYGFVLFLRAFARLLGFSTGILALAV